MFFNYNNIYLPYQAPLFEKIEGIQYFSDIGPLIIMFSHLIKSWPHIIFFFDHQQAVEHIVSPSLFLQMLPFRD